MNKPIYHVITSIQTELLGPKRIFTFNDQCGYFIVITDSETKESVAHFYANKFAFNYNEAPLGCIPMKCIEAIYIKEEKSKETKEG